jgi:hypothetical protein
MEIRNIISKFIANLFEKNYAEANKNLQTIVESKIKTRVASIMEAKEAKESSKVKGAKDKGSMFDGKQDKKFPKKKGSKKPVSKKQEAFLKKIGVKKDDKKKSSKGDK